MNNTELYKVIGQKFDIPLHEYEHLLPKAAELAAASAATSSTWFDPAAKSRTGAPFNSGSIQPRQS